METERYILEKVEKLYKINELDGPHVTEPLSFLTPTLHTHQTKLTAMMRSRGGALLFP